MKKKFSAKMATRDAEMKARAELNNSERHVAAWSILGRNDSDTFSDVTLPVNHERNDGPEVVKVFDHESIYSVSPRGYG